MDEQYREVRIKYPVVQIVGGKEVWPWCLHRADVPDKTLSVNLSFASMDMFLVLLTASSFFFPFFLLHFHLMLI